MSICVYVILKEAVVFIIINFDSNGEVARLEHRVKFQSSVLFFWRNYFVERHDHPLLNWNSWRLRWIIIFTISIGTDFRIHGCLRSVHLMLTLRLQETHLD